MSEIIYILINEAMPGYAKVGRTSDIERRVRELDTTSVPLPFECVYAARVENAIFVERQLHSAFADNRVRSNREFFEIAPERIVAALKLAELEDVTPRNDLVETQEDQAALNRARSRRGVFNFEMVDIPAGSILTFSRAPEMACVVLDKRNVEFEGERTSLSASAAEILNRLGFYWQSVNGTDYWQFEGEPLSERRRRMEEE